MSDTSREIRLASRPEGRPTDDNFELAEVPVPEPGEGQALVRNEYLSVDPYMRGRMRDAKSYVPPFEVGKVMEGGAVGQVVASNSPDLNEGDWVSTQLGWREHSLVDAQGRAAGATPTWRPCPPSLGVLGMPGFTAWTGLTEFGKPKEGETAVRVRRGRGGGLDGRASWASCAACAWWAARARTRRWSC